MEVSAGQPSAGELIDILAAHFLRSRSCSIQLERILLAQPSNADTVTGGELAERAFHVLDVSLVDLANTQPMLVEQVVKDPLLLLKHFQRACTVSQHYMQAKHERSEHMQVKPNTKVRVFGIPGAHEPCLYKETLHSRKLVSPRVGEIRSCMSNRLITICGTITKLGSPHLVEYKQQFECNRCHMRFDVDIDIHAGGHVQLPEVCPNNSARNRGRKRRKKQRRASNNNSQQSQQSHSQSQSQSQMIEEEASGGCQGVHFSRCEEVRFHKDCQEIRVQELTYRGSNRNSSSRGSAGTGGGGGGGGGGRQNPKSITVRLEDELVDQFRPGDDVQVTGVLIQHWRRVGRVEMQCDVELVVDAVHVAHLNKMGKASFDFNLTKKEEAPLSLMKPSAVSASPSNALEPFGNPSDADKDFDGWVRQHWEKYASKPLAGRNLIVGSLSPQVHGMFMAKLAVMLVLCGGVPLQSNTNLLQSDKTTRAGGAQPQQSLKSHSVRGECHLLLAGDPGTGKSQLMRCAAKLSKRSVVTNGRGSTNAGLTATAVISRGGGGGAGGSAALKGSGGGGKLGKGGRGSEWTLEAGALVLADGGVCCIDEFETMREADRAAIHEAMEQQTLSIAKAGLVTKLRAQTAIIASTNIKKPKSNKRQQIDPFTMGFDESMVNISAPLLSRFDLVLTVRDLSLKQWDSLIADHVLDQHCEDANRCAPLRGVNDPREKPSHWWSQDMMKQYVEYVRSLRPVMTSAAEEVLKLYYQKQRQLSASESYNRPSSRTTIRMLESLVRLSQAHARLMARGQVRIQDAVAAISLMESSMKTSLILGVQNVTQSLAPTDPDGEYTRMEEMVLRALGIDDHKSPSNNGYLLSGPALSLSCP